MSELRISGMYDMSRFSPALQEKLQQCGIRVVETTRRNILDAGLKTWFMAMALESKTLIIVKDDFQRDYASFSDEEIEAMMWHEIGHLRLNTSDEKMADEYAITKAGQEAWLFGIMKTWVILCHQKPDKKYVWGEKYAHRTYWTRLFLMQHKMTVPAWLK